MEEKVKDLIVIFTSIFYEALPFIVLGSVISGVLEHLVPQQAITRIVPKSRPVAILLGCLLGLVFPMCECGIVPVMRRLLRKGLPLSCCAAYMMAGPVINPVVILSTWVAFKGYESGWIIVALRVGMALVVAFVTACFIDRLDRKHGYDLLTPAARPSSKTTEEEAEDRAAGLWVKLGRIAETALHDFVDITVFLTLGAMLAAISRLFITSEQIQALGGAFPALAILAMMGLAILLCLCSEADAFVAASFSTLPPAPKLAFLVLGPMLDIKLYILFTRVFRAKVIWTIIAGVVIQTFVYSMIAHFVLPPTVGTNVSIAPGN